MLQLMSIFLFFKLLFSSKTFAIPLLALTAIRKSSSNPQHDMTHLSAVTLRFYDIISS